MASRNWRRDLQRAAVKALRADDTDPDASNGFYCVHHYIANKIIRGALGLGEQQLIDMGAKAPYATVLVYGGPEEVALPSTQANLRVDLFANRDWRIDNISASGALELLADRIDVLFKTPVALNDQVSTLVVSMVSRISNLPPMFDDAHEKVHLPMTYLVKVLTSDF